MEYLQDVDDDEIIFMRIGGGENVPLDGETEQPPTITINDGHAVALSRTVFYSRRIPAEGGFTFRDIFAMASRLQVRGPWLAAQLSREEFGGAAGQHAADLALIYYGATLNTIRNDIIVNTAMRRIIGNVNNIVSGGVSHQQEEEENAEEPPPLPHIPRLIICPYRSVPYEEICAICTDTRAEKPRLSWAFAEGCEAHRFHSVCIRGWGGGTCPMCRAPLVNAASEH